MIHQRMLLVISAIGLVTGSMTGMAAGFPEKDITIVIPNRPGGGFDVYARATARYMQKYLPNKVNVIPKNMTGAGGRKGTTAVYRSKPDGYTFVILNVPGIVIPQILGQKVAYDISKMSFIGRIGNDKYAIVVRKNSRFKSVADLQNATAPIRFVALSPGMTQYVASKISLSALGIKSDDVSGYRGIRGMLVALIRGDGDAGVTAVGTALPFIESGDVVPLASFGPKGMLSGVPTAKDIGNANLGYLGLERVLAGPPGIPEKTRKILESAVEKAVKSSEMIAWAKETKRSLNWADGAESKRIVDGATKFYLGYKQYLGKKKKKKK